MRAVFVVFVYISSRSTVLDDTICVEYVKDISLSRNLISSFAQVRTSGGSASEHVKWYDPESQEEVGVTNSSRETCCCCCI